jgi:hypothetical protein
MNHLPLAIENPTAKGLVHSAPGGKVMRQVPPLATGSKTIEYGVDYFPLQGSRFTASLGLAGFEHRLLENSPLGIGQVGIVLLATHNCPPEEVGGIRITIYDSQRYVQEICLQSLKNWESRF